MIKREKKLAAELLFDAGEKFANNMCNDVDESYFDGWTLAQRRKFVKEFHEWNGDIEDYNENHLHIPDFALMKFISHRLNSK